MSGTAGHGVRRAMVLAAGHGKRLRPLTDQVAKPALPFCGRPILSRVLDLAAEHGVLAATVNVHHAPQSIHACVAARGEAPPAVDFSDETRELLGTAGALIPVKERFRDAGPFFLLNGDCVHRLDLAGLAARHAAARADDPSVVATVAVRDHAEPGFGCLVSRDDRIVDFGVRARGEPGEHHYLSAMVLEPSVLDLLADEARPDEIFARVLPESLRAGGSVAFMTSDAEWHAVDTPERYLAATRDFLERRGRGAHVDPSADVAPGASISSDSAVHEDCVVERGARLVHSVLLPGALVEESAHVERSILGPGARVRREERVEGEVRA